MADRHELSHSHGAANERRTLWCALLTGGFMCIEVAGGVIAGSLALIADAGHMLTDFASLALAWFAFRLSRRPATWKRTYGFDRFQVVAAFVNGLSLFPIAAWIVWEAAWRFADPVPVLGGPMAAVAAAGLAVNLLAFWILHGADRENLNIRGATLHVLGDLLGSVAALAAAGIIIATGWTPIDPLLSVLVALLILRSGWMLVRDAGHILLEGAPDGLDNREVRHDLTAAIDGVDDVHHVHVWSITDERRMMTLHARLADTAPAEATRAAIKSRLHDQFGIEHATVEIERGACPDDAAKT